MAAKLFSFAPPCLLQRSCLARRYCMLALCSLLAFLGSCESIPFPEKPYASLTPVFAALTLTGDARMESGSLTLGKKSNRSVDLSSGLNIADRDSAVGGTLAWGDGFAGVEFGFLRWDEHAFTTQGKLGEDFGGLDKGDAVSTEVLFEQWRLEYLAKLYETKISKKGRFRAALGLGLHHNNLEFQARSLGATAGREQNLDLRDGGMPVLRTRLETEWKPLRLRFDAGYSQGHWRKIDGEGWDLKFTARYTPKRGVTLFAGFQAYDLPFKGGSEGLDYEFDTRLAGWVFGLELRF